MWEYVPIYWIFQNKIPVLSNLIIVVINVINQLNGSQLYHHKNISTLAKHCENILLPAKR